MPVALDAQIGAVVDDGTAEGAVRLLPSDLVRVPISNQAELTIDPNGYLSFTQNNNAYYNPDGTGSVLSVKTSQGTNSVFPTNSVRERLYGRVIGVGWYVNYGTPNNSDFTVMIDGVAYDAQNTITEPDLQTVVTNPAFDPYHYQIFAANLPDGPHTVDLVFPYSPAHVNSWQIFGFILEKRCYPAYASRLANFGTAVLPQSVPTSSGTVLPTSEQFIVHGVDRVDYVNTTNSFIMVTMTKGNGTAASTIAVIPVPAQSSARYAFPGPVAMVANATATSTGAYSHSASASGLTCVAWGPLL